MQTVRSGNIIAHKNLHNQITNKNLTVNYLLKF
jgi:hypothetical protein